jgi:hypothetical protein
MVAHCMMPLLLRSDFRPLGLSEKAACNNQAFNVETPETHSKTPERGAKPDKLPATKILLNK